MTQPWSEITAFYRQLDHGQNDEAFWLACREIGSLADAISQTQLTHSLFGWTSMHDLCIQQRDVPPGSGPYLRLSPTRSGHVEFRMIDTYVEARQWHCEVDAIDTKWRFASFLNQLKWFEQNEAGSLLQ